MFVVFSMQAGAAVYVYNFKDVDTGVYYDIRTGWGRYQNPYYGGYFIIGPGSDSTRIHIWTIWTWKYGTDKYCDAVDWGEVNLVAGDIPSGRKTKRTWVISDAGNESRTMLAGAAKVQKIGSAKSKSCLNCHTVDELAVLGDIAPNIPSAMKGYQMWDFTIFDGDVFTSRNIYTSQMKLTLNSKKIFQYHQEDDAGTVKDALVTELQNAGYISY